MPRVSGGSGIGMGNHIPTGHRVSRDSVVPLYACTSHQRRTHNDNLNSTNEAKIHTWHRSTVPCLREKKLLPPISSDETGERLLWSPGEGGLVRTRSCRDCHCQTRLMLR